MKNRFFGSALAVGSAFILMIAGEGGKGGLILWPLFGATNQMLASLTLFVISIYLIKKKKNSLPFMIPAVLITFVTTYALSLNIWNFYKMDNIFLTIFAGILFLIEVVILIEGIKIVIKTKENR